MVHTGLQARSLKNESQIIKPLFEIPGLRSILYSLSEIGGRARPLFVRNFFEKVMSVSASVSAIWKFFMSASVSAIQNFVMFVSASMSAVSQ